MTVYLRYHNSVGFRREWKRDFEVFNEGKINNHFDARMTRFENFRKIRELYNSKQGNFLIKAEVLITTACSERYRTRRTFIRLYFQADYKNKKEAFTLLTQNWRTTRSVLLWEESASLRHVIFAGDVMGMSQEVIDQRKTAECSKFLVRGACLRNFLNVPFSAVCITWIGHL